MGKAAKFQAAKLALSCIGRLPPRVRALIGRWGGYLFSFVPTRDRAIAKLQMEMALKNEGGSSCLGQVYASLGETLLESVNLKPMLDRYQEYVDADWAQMDEILARKKGVIILSAHTGNWDLLAACSVKRGFKVSVIGKPTKNLGLQELLVEVRANYGVDTIWRSDSSGIKQIFNALKGGEAVAALIDQDTQVTSLMVPFFGRPAATPKTIIEFAKKFDAVIVAPLICRTSTNHYRIIVKEFDTKLPTEEILLGFNQYLEKFVHQHPSQWVWIHKRWRTLADGTRLSSREYLKTLQQAAR